jgi:hypothetical protein
MDSTRKPPPTLAAVMATLDELGRAARADNGPPSRDALRTAHQMGLCADQVRDAYQWGRRDLGPATFIYEGEGD